MSEKQFEECSLSEASHVEVNGKVYLLGGNEVLLESYHGEWIGILWIEQDVFIPVDAFPIFGIKTFKEIKPEPIEFEAIFCQYNGKWHPLYSLGKSTTIEFAQIAARFRCVQIVEED